MGKEAYLLIARKFLLHKFYQVMNPLHSRLKVKVAENAWKTRNPEIVVQAYTSGSKWRNRTEFFTGREAIVNFSSASGLRNSITDL